MPLHALNRPRCPIELLPLFLAVGLAGAPAIGAPGTAPPSAEEGRYVSGPDAPSDRLAFVLVHRGRVEADPGGAGVFEAHAQVLTDGRGRGQLRLHAPDYRILYRIQRGHVECEEGQPPAVVLTGILRVERRGGVRVGAFVARVSSPDPAARRPSDLRDLPLHVHLEEDLSEDSTGRGGHAMAPTQRHLETTGDLDIAADACTRAPQPSTRTAAAPRASTGAVPLMDMGPEDEYLGFRGGLYPTGPAPPQQHHDEGLARARAIAPLDTLGRPDPEGAVVLLSVGMSNTSHEFCSLGGSLPCDTFTFAGQAAADPDVRHGGLVIANGARSGQTARRWTSPASSEYDRVRDRVLAPLGLSERQVQAAWVKVANPRPFSSLPAPDADAYVLLEDLGRIVRALRTRYPNLQQVFLSSRTYGGYAASALNPEPFAYESGFAVKWLIEAQILQAETGVPDPRVGDLDPTRAAPWLAWGPYLWADGMQTRSDGLGWAQDDFRRDGTHPSTSGREKVGSLLLTFFKTSPYTRCWFLEAGGCE